MKKMIELVFREYKTKDKEIESGFINGENVVWVTDHLMLKHLTNEELSQMWEAVHCYFTENMLNETGDTWRTDIPKEDFMFLSDTSSAWLEVINSEARRRKNIVGGTN